MVKKKLVEELIKDGARLLRDLDRRNFPVESMFWIHLPDEDYWRLVIASPFVAQEGSVAGYWHLNELLLQLKLAGVVLEDISLLDPQSAQFQSLYSLASGSSRLAAGPAWVEFEEAIVYRWTGASVSAELNCRVSAGELQEFWEAERERSSLSHPALLISEENRRITFRFHPQHGPQTGIENIKRVFEIALHRENARPDCKVNWLN